MKEKYKMQSNTQRKEVIICELWKSKSSFNENTRKKVWHKNRTKSRKEEKQMKKTLQGFIFWTIAIAFILLMTTIGQALASVITMDMIMTVVYTVLGYGITYILKN